MSLLASLVGARGDDFVPSLHPPVGVQDGVACRGIRLFFFPQGMHMHDGRALLQLQLLAWWVPCFCDKAALLLLSC